MSWARNFSAPTARGDTMKPMSPRRARLIVQNLDLISRVRKKLRAEGVDWESAGQRALESAAVARQRGRGFQAFASACIRNSLRTEIKVEDARRRRESRYGLGEREEREYGPLYEAIDLHDERDRELVA